MTSILRAMCGIGHCTECSIIVWNKMAAKLLVRVNVLLNSLLAPASILAHIARPLYRMPNSVDCP